jgi:hypothetical protein
MSPVSSPTGKVICVVETRAALHTSGSCGPGARTQRAFTLLSAIAPCFAGGRGCWRPGQCCQPERPWPDCDQHVLHPWLLQLLLRTARGCWHEGQGHRSGELCAPTRCRRRRATASMTSPVGRCTCTLSSPFRPCPPTCAAVNRLLNWTAMRALPPVAWPADQF